MRMHRSGQCKCLNCHGFYVPDARNIKRQKYCTKPDCRKACKAASQRAWLGKDENKNHFRGAENVQRVQAWRAGHPGYWRRKRAREPIGLQETLNLQPADVESKAKQDGAGALQDLLKSQDPLVLGLVIHVADLALQEDIVGVTQMLISKGRAMMGERPGGLTYEKQNRDGGTGAACALAV